MKDSRLGYIVASLRERLWVKPALHAILSLAVVGGASALDMMFGWSTFIPDVDSGTLTALLTIVASTMLGVATFAVASMVSAFASASTSATPRAFKLVVADNVSQYALSVFLAAFIFAFIALTAVQLGYLQKLGRFVLFCALLGYLGWVVLTFVRWVDSIARLGRMGDTISKVESATISALGHWGPAARLGTGRGTAPHDAIRIFTREGEDGDSPPLGIGHVMLIDLEGLGDWAEKHGAEIYFHVTVGSFVTGAEPIASVAFPDSGRDGPDVEEAATTVRKACILGTDRSYNLDPRFGLIGLSEIACRALSPGINDPGTAIDVIQRMARIFSVWDTILAQAAETTYPRIHIAPLDPEILFDDAFAGIARDGARMVEIGVWLQQCFASLAALNNRGISDAARVHSRRALERAQVGLAFPHDRKRVEQAAAAVEDRLSP